MVFFFLSAVHPRDLHSFPTRRSSDLLQGPGAADGRGRLRDEAVLSGGAAGAGGSAGTPAQGDGRSEEHTSELQSRFDLVCRLLLEKKMHVVIDIHISPATGSLLLVGC